MQQKSWTDLLGSDLTGCKVEDHFIVRHMEGDWFKVIWSFDSPEDAKRVFEQWKKENSH